MMKIVSLLPLAALTLFIPLTGCRSPQPHQVAFDESAFTRAAVAGSGTVSGRAYAVDQGNEFPANQEPVELVPVNAYTRETIQRGLLGGRILQPDPRLARYRRTTTSDAQGNFTLSHIPPGEYYLSSLAEWEHHYESENADDTGTDKMVAEHKKPIFAQISVPNAHSIRVTQWNQHCPDIGPPFAHGE